MYHLAFIIPMYLGSFVINVIPDVNYIIESSILASAIRHIYVYRVVS